MLNLSERSIFKSNPDDFLLTHTVQEKNRTNFRIGRPGSLQQWGQVRARQDSPTGVGCGSRINLLHRTRCCKKAILARISI